MQPWEILLQRILNARRWPLPGEHRIHRMLHIWAALRENNEPAIRLLMQWPQDRPLIIDNLPEKIGTAYGDLLFGRAPRVTPADPADLQRLKDLTDSFHAELSSAEETCCSEGEVWWRLTTDPSLPHPLLTWHTRRDVVPMLRGRDAVAVAFIDRLEPIGADRKVVYRHLEIHGEGTVRNFLFRGRLEALGELVDLGRHYATADLAPTWDTGLPILAGRIVNRWGRRPTVGVSIYAGVWSRMLALNETTTIGRENARLTAKKRLTGPASALRPTYGLQPRPDHRIPTIDGGDGMRVPLTPTPAFQLDAGEDFIANDPLEIDEGGTGNNQIKVLEYSFDAAALIEWLKFEIETICQRCDIVPQFIGSGDFGTAESGTALRVRLIPTTNGADGRGGPWDLSLPIITQRAQLLESLDPLNGGLGRPWTNPGGLPQIVRADPLPADQAEIANRQSTLKTANLISIETSLRERYPDADEDWIGQEVDRIRADEAANMPAAPTFGV